MKIVMERNHLLKALGRVQKVVEMRNTYPILSNVLIRTVDDAIEMRATDLDIEITERVPASIQDPGVITVPAHKFYEIIRKFSDGAEIRIEDGANDNLTLISGRSRFNLPTLSADSFPDLKSGTFVSSFTVATATFLELIERTGFAASTEETRYYLNGIYLHTLDAGAGQVLRAVATDGHRLARMDVEAPEGSIGMPGIIIPRKTVAELRRLLDGATGDVQIEVSDTKIRVQIGDAVMLSKLIQGTFPDYERVTPKYNEKQLDVDRLEFATAVDRVSTIATDRGGKSVRLAYSEGVLELSVSNPDHGEAREEMPASFTENTFSIGFNARYLLDIIAQIKTDTAVFMLNDANSPSIIQESGDGKVLYVLMPMRV